MYSSTTQRTSVVRDIVATDKTNQLSKLVVSNSTINNSGGSASDNAKTSKDKKVYNSNNDEETATENSVKVADRKRLTYADMAKLGVAERAAGSASDAATVVNDAATVNDAADNASAVPGEDKPRPAGSRPTSTASSRLSSRDVLKSS
ncbi:hypothetical protein T12_9960 [Trichinella patagoniensis]|uniref:Uncharacterized protein n=2 Tax=Trichinella patagoniensis TaxID=990121 RepID=A0A0V1A619_9BILA|nr:hypothetical protein T12_9960 [Trichinella patagoniensis]